MIVGEAVPDDDAAPAAEIAVEASVGEAVPDDDPAATVESSAVTARVEAHAAAPEQQLQQQHAQKCSICLLDVLPDQHRSAAHPASGCIHSFHWACLAASLAVDTSCPNCRRPYHEHGVYEISPGPEGDTQRLHRPELRMREPSAGGPAADVQYTLGEQCCQHRLAYPMCAFLALLLGLLLCSGVLFLLANDTGDTQEHP
jgi:hypothetical protein